MFLFLRNKKKRQGILLDYPLDGNQQCADCDAACCRGFPSVRLSPEEYERLEQLGAKRLNFTLNGRFYLIIEHGCEFLDGNRCGIHQQRPDICRRFICKEPDD